MTIDQHTRDMVVYGAMILFFIGRAISMKSRFDPSARAESNDNMFRMFIPILIIAALGVGYFFMSGGTFSGNSPLQLH